MVRADLQLNNRGEGPVDDDRHRRPNSTPGRTPKHRRHRGCLTFQQEAPGFTYLGVLILVVVTGIALTGASTYWSTVVKREREAELLFRGDQIRKAIQSYHQWAPQGRAKSYPNTIQDLLKDPRSLEARRHLRKWYPDPMSSDGQWTIFRDAAGRIKGVASASTAKPLKRGNFPPEYKDFDKAKSYANWIFEYSAPKSVAVPKGNSSASSQSGG